MFNRLLESSHRDDSNKWSNIGFTKEKTQVVPIEVFSFWNFEILTEAAASVRLSVVQNSLDPNETPSNSASHSGPSSLSVLID